MRSRWLAMLVVLLSVSGWAQEYKLALPGYRFEFPRDYFNHEDYQTEWWYYTGNLRSTDGHRFGFELTFFRQGMSGGASENPWSARDVWMAHMALSDVNGQRFYHEERLNRSGPGIAGVDEASGVVWNGNWKAVIRPGHEELQGVGEKFGYALDLKAAKPPVIQGQNGVSQKAAGVGHASHYFSLTRLITTGEIDVDGRRYRVEGSSWMDHEFFTGSMIADESGWDWLSVQLEDGSELMLYRMRHRDGTADAYSSGTYVPAKGDSEFLSSAEFSMRPGTERWTSAETRATYPLSWHVSVPKLGLELDVTTPLRAQELVDKVGPSYWEGTIDVQGTRDGRAARGVGYLEMTGYEAGWPVLPSEPSYAPRTRANTSK